MSEETAADGAARATSLREDLARTWDTLAGADEAGGERIEAGDADAADDEAASPSAAPGHWPAGWRARLDTLDGEARACVLDLHQRLEEAHSAREDALVQREKRLDGLAAAEEALAPYRGELARAGVSEAEALRSLAAAHGLLLRDPAAGLRWIAGAYGVDPGATTTRRPCPTGTPRRRGNSTGSTRWRRALPRARARAGRTARPDFPISMPSGRRWRR